MQFFHSRCKKSSVASRTQQTLHEKRVMNGETIADEAMKDRHELRMIDDAVHGWLA